MYSSTVQKNKMSNIFKYVGVHDYVMHADEVVAIAVIRYLYGEPTLIRISARDDDALQLAAKGGYTLVDVGGGIFDHHSPEARKNTYSNGVIKSALGLVLDQAVRDDLLSQDEVDYLLINGLYALQAADNGQDYNGVSNPFDFIQWLNAANPNDSDAQMAAFNMAVDMSLKIIKPMIDSAKKSMSDHEVCFAAFGEMSDGIADLPHYVRDAVIQAQLWNSRHDENKVRFFTFQGTDGAYRIQAVNKIGSFALEYELPYKGLRNKDLCEVAGIPDGIFVHPNGFIAAAKTLESCRKLGMMA